MEKILIMALPLWLAGSCISDNDSVPNGDGKVRLIATATFDTKQGSEMRVYNYDRKNRLIKVVSASGYSQSFAYAVDKITMHKAGPNGASLTSVYSLDEQGYIVRRIDQQGKQDEYVVDYTYNNEGRLVSSDFTKYTWIGDELVYVKMDNGTVAEVDEYTYSTRENRLNLNVLEFLNGDDAGPVFEGLEQPWLPDKQMSNVSTATTTNSFNRIYAYTMDAEGYPLAISSSDVSIRLTYYH